MVRVSEQNKKVKYICSSSPSPLAVPEACLLLLWTRKCANEHRCWGHTDPGGTGHERIPAGVPRVSTHQRLSGQRGVPRVL